MVVGIISVVVMIILQTGAMFYWGGVMTRTTRDHEKRIEDLEVLHPATHT